jgi:pimeloyl-ACP methyl ester carboxylesterase
VRPAKLLCDDVHDNLDALRDRCDPNHGVRVAGVGQTARCGSDFSRSGGARPTLRPACQSADRRRLRGYANDHRGHGTSISEQVTLGGFGAAGWSGLVSDLVAISNQIRTQRPELPLFLVGHSMGSFALQEAILDHSAVYAGAVLSGSTAVDLLAARLTEAGGASGDLSAFNAGFVQPRRGHRVRRRLVGPAHPRRIVLGEADELAAQAESVRA